MLFAGDYNRRLYGCCRENGVSGSCMHYCESADYYRNMNDERWDDFQCQEAFQTIESCVDTHGEETGTDFLTVFTELPI